MATFKLPYNQDYHYIQTETQDGVKHEPHLTLDEAITRSRDFLLSLQHPDGYWWGELEANVTTTAHAILLYKILGIDNKYPLNKMEKYLRRTQCAHGGWELFYGDGGYLSATIEAYMALRLLDVPKADPALQRALKFITSRGGISKSRIFTKIFLALIGSYDWRGIPSLPPWLVLLPSWFPVSIYDAAGWARGSVVPLTIVFDKKPVFKICPEVSFDELYAEGRENVCFSMAFAGDWISKFFVGVDYVLKAMESVGFVPFRQRGIEEAERWVLERQEDSGDYHSLYAPMFYSIVCMKTLGYAVTNPILHRAILSYKAFSVETEDECWVQSTVSPVWDTAFTIRSLVESGIEPDHPALQRAGEWLLKKQNTKHGDWSSKVHNGHKNAGGWGFQFFNRWYPDVDDSAAVVMALNVLQLQNEEIKNGAIARCVNWIRSLQCKRGGWAGYDKDNDKNWLNSIPFDDFNAMSDPNTADVTARVLEMVGRLKMAGRDAEAASMPPDAIARGLAYLRKEQEKEGCWYGRWGVNYIYGTCGVLMALSIVGPALMHKEEMERGARWLVEVQNKHQNGSKTDMTNGQYGISPEGNIKDGGWGESCFSYTDPGRKGKSEVGSTASQTAWALQGLLAAGDALGRYEVEAIEQGVQYLVSTQRKDGSWKEAQFTGTGFPRMFYLRYHLYAQHFPLSALSRYRARLQTHKIIKPEL